MRTPKYTVHNKLRMPGGFLADGFLSALESRSRPEDILVSTYPKCGTTWMQHIIWLIVHGGRPLHAEQRLSRVFPHLEEMGIDALANLPEPRLIKTHLPYGLSHWHPETRIVYVARNPFDCVVSFFHHTRGFVRYYEFGDGTFDEYFECFVRGQVDFGDYFENVLSWFNNRADENIHRVTYELMSADPLAGITAVGEFLGSQWASNVRDSDVLEQILHHSSFDEMSQDQLRWASERPKDMPAFVRKGAVGDWRQHFSREQTVRMLERIESIPDAAKLVTLWPETMAAAGEFAGS